MYGARYICACACIIVEFQLHGMGATLSYILLMLFTS